MSKIFNYIIKRLGGYTKDEILTETVKNLFNTIDGEDILKEENGKWTMYGIEMSDGEKRMLVAEAAAFVQSRLWKVLHTDIKYRANKAMFEEAKSETDLIAGKLWLYTLDCFSTRLKSLSKGSGYFNSDKLIK